MRTVVSDIFHLAHVFKIHPCGSIYQYGYTNVCLDPWFQFGLTIYPKVELLDYMVIQCLIFEELAYCIEQ